MNRTTSLRRACRGLFAALCLSAASAASLAAAAIGQPAPAFTAVDTAGKPVSLSDYRGKTVVLEWVNPGCPYVRKHYGASNMQATQKAAVDKGVVWLAVNSTASDATDYLAPQRMAAWMHEQRASATATLMDTDGRVGRAFGARTTPHMYVIDPQGTLVYAGAIDNRPTARASDIPGATNHVHAALDQVLAGKPVSVPATQPYGCTVKYSSM
jgi:thiol-disulfide isomerase/thioredoxin